MTKKSHNYNFIQKKSNDISYHKFHTEIYYERKKCFLKVQMIWEEKS